MTIDIHKGPWRTCLMSACLQALVQHQSLRMIIGYLLTQHWTNRLNTTKEHFLKSMLNRQDKWPVAGIPQMKYGGTLNWFKQPFLNQQQAYPRESWHFIIRHGGDMKLKKSDILCQYVCSCPVLFVVHQLVVSFDDVSKFVSQVILANEIQCTCPLNIATAGFLIDQKQKHEQQLLSSEWKRFSLKIKSSKHSSPRVPLHECAKNKKKVKNTWFLAAPFITTAGLTHNGGTGKTVPIIQSGLANLGSMPNAWHSSSVIRLKISWILSAVTSIFFSWESSLTCFHSAVMVSPLRRYWGWWRPHPPWPW